MKIFNLVIVGYGGQGILTVSEIIARTALKEGLKTKEAELHGLAQRGGSLDCHLRFGKKIYSPLVAREGADLIMALDALEALRACYWANRNTAVLINLKVFNSAVDLSQIISKIRRVTEKIYLVDADREVEKLTGDITAVNIFMLGYALKKKLLPFKKEDVWKAIEKRLHKQFLEQNKKVFEAAALMKPFVRMAQRDINPNEPSKAV